MQFPASAHFPSLSEVTVSVAVHFRSEKLPMQFWEPLQGEGGGWGVATAVKLYMRAPDVRHLKRRALYQPLLHAQHCANFQRVFYLSRLTPNYYTLQPLEYYL